MITRRTKIQLMIFVLITLVGVSYVGARYARLDRLVVDDSYTVVAHFPDSGGIFAGGEVTYRGVRVGQVELARADRRGRRRPPRRSRRTTTRSRPTRWRSSATGPRSASSTSSSSRRPTPSRTSRTTPRSPTENTRTPIATQTLLTHLSDTVESVDQEALETTVTEMGKAFDGTGEDLGRMIDSGNSFIEAGQRQLRRHHRPDPGQQHRAQGPDRLGQRDPRVRHATCSLFSGTLAGSDRDLRAVIDNGSADRHRAAHLPRGQRGRAGRADQQPGHHRRGRGQAPRRHRAGARDLPLRRRGRLHGRLQVPGHRAVRRPLRPDPPAGAARVHTTATRAPNQRPPQDGSNAPDERERPVHRARRPEQRARRPARTRRAGAAYRAPVVASYDPKSGKLDWGDGPGEATARPVRWTPPAGYGEESWKWLLLRPLAR